MCDPNAMTMSTRGAVMYSAHHLGLSKRSPALDRGAPQFQRPVVGGCEEYRARSALI